MTTDLEPSPRIQSAARAAAVLVEVARAGPKGVSAKELAATLGVPRQTVYHLVQTLQAVKMLRRASSTSYVLGLAVGTIAHGFRRQLVATDSIHEIADEVAARTGETAYVTGWIENDITVLASVRSPAAVAAEVVPLGISHDAHTRASGKLLLSMRGNDEIAQYIQSHPLVARTPRSITTHAAFAEEIAVTRARLLGTDDEEYVAGISCMAVPLGKAPTSFAIGISAPTERFHTNSERYETALRAISAGYDTQL